MEEDPTIANVSAYSDHAVRGDHLYGAESLIITEIIKPGMLVLDIGCGTGRVTRALARAGAKVNACDMDSNALGELKATSEGLPIIAQLADARKLPYEDQSFDAVFFAFNGLDFLRPLDERERVILEMSRVLKPGGHLVISSHNSLGSLFTPRGIFRIRSIKDRIASLFQGRFLTHYSPDMAGLILYQGTPKDVISQIERITPLRFLSCYSQTGKISSILLLSIFSPWPYYLFEKR